MSYLEHLNVRQHIGHVTACNRATLLGQRPVTIWFTGLSASGKSTLAYALERWLHDAGRAVYVLDGDNVRLGLNSDLGFSPSDRKENIRRIAEVARLMNDAGLIVITAFISPYRADREMAETIIGAPNYREVYVNTSMAVCEFRDPKGLYKRARAGNLKAFTGIDAPYEPPDCPALVLDTATISVEECVRQLCAMCHC